MPPPDLLGVSRGLTLVHWGFRLIAATTLAVAALLVVFFSFDCSQGWKPSYLYAALLFLLLLGIPTPTIIGTLILFTGRLLCLRTPPELPTARTRIRFAVILEGCGLMTFLLNWVVAQAYGPAAGRAQVLPNEVMYGVYLFAFALLAAGKAFFYAYSVALAKAVDMQVSHRPSVAVVTLIVCGSGVFATLFSLVNTQGKTLSTLTEVLTAGLAFGVAICVFGTLYLYGRHLRRLREAVKRFNTPPAKEVALVLVQRPR